MGGKNKMYPYVVKRLYLCFLKGNNFVIHKWSFWADFVIKYCSKVKTFEDWVIVRIK